MDRAAWSFSCSQNAHDRNVLAWDKSASRRARGWADENVCVQIVCCLPGQNVSCHLVSGPHSETQPRAKKFLDAGRQDLILFFPRASGHVSIHRCLDLQRRGEPFRGRLLEVVPY